jgi:hypothetical protein
MDADLSTQAVSDMVADARKRCYFARDGVLNADGQTDAAHLLRILSHMIRFRLAGQAGGRAFDVQRNSSGVLRVSSLAGFDHGALLREFRRTIALLLELNLFEAAHVSASTTAVSVELAYERSVEAAAGSLCITAEGAPAEEAWFGRLLPTCVEYMFAIGGVTFYSDMNLALCQFVLVVLHGFGASAANPVVLRFHDYTEEEEGLTDMLVGVDMAGPVSLADSWDLRACRLARYALMEENVAWRCGVVRTSYADALTATVRYRKELHWDGCRTSLYYTDDMVAVARRTAFRAVELTRLFPYLQRLLGAYPGEVTLMSTGKAANLVLDLCRASHFGSSSIAKATLALPTLSVTDCMAWCAAQGTPLRCIAVHACSLTEETRGHIVPCMVLPLWAACRFGRLYANMGEREVVVQIDDNAAAAGRALALAKLGKRNKGGAEATMPFTAMVRRQEGAAAKPRRSKR